MQWERKLSGPSEGAADPPLVCPPCVVCAWSGMTIDMAFTVECSFLCLWCVTEFAEVK